MLGPRVTLKWVWQRPQKTCLRTPEVLILRRTTRQHLRDTFGSFAQNILLLLVLFLVLILVLVLFLLVVLVLVVLVFILVLLVLALVLVIIVVNPDYLHAICFSDFCLQFFSMINTFILQRWIAGDHKSIKITQHVTNKASLTNANNWCKQ